MRIITSICIFLGIFLISLTSLSHFPKLSTVHAGDATTAWGIASPEFTVSVATFSPFWTGLSWGGTRGNVDNLLARVLNALILFIWVAAIFFMTIGAGYMIIYHGQDELLSKWKTIFTAWLIAIVVALSAWIIVRLFVVLLYGSSIISL